MNLGDAVTTLRSIVDNLGLNRDLCVQFLNKGLVETSIRIPILRKCIHTDLVANTYLYTHELTDYIRLAKVDIMGVGKLKIVDPDFMAQNSTDAGENTGTPEYVTVEIRDGSRVIRLSPTPAESKTDGLWIWYIKSNPFIDNDADEPELPEEFRFPGVMYAAWLFTKNPDFYGEFEKLIRVRQGYIPQNRAKTLERIKF
jgi:hypothetical protein